MAIHNLKHLKQYRKELRNNLTPAEATLWKYLKNSKLGGRKFRRQHSVGNYILDFYCPSEKIGIELDGECHNDYTSQMYDEDRTKFLEEKGITVIRFDNEDVFQSEELVCKKIRTYFKNVL